jgi:hypothetical protein
MKSNLEGLERDARSPLPSSPSCRGVQYFEHFVQMGTAKAAFPNGRSDEGVIKTWQRTHPDGDWNLILGEGWETDSYLWQMTCSNHSRRLQQMQRVKDANHGSWYLLGSKMCVVHLASCFFLRLSYSRSCEAPLGTYPYISIHIDSYRQVANEKIFLQRDSLS